ncbi:branched-chain amino acid ABC transporter permease [Streptomyces sp. NPDC085927]|uniref:branched-chain amino acid ABC transporter permease n=1 Tax=Streptomyces sp. NPDC085927 TaxID=3365738 RepID=UPI0037D513BA
MRLGSLLALAAVVLCAGALGDATLRYSLTIGTVYAVAVLGNNAINGTLGEINLAAGAYMAVGAYTMAWGLNNGWSLLASLALVILTAVVVGALIAVPTIRLTGIFTALATFTLAFAIPDLAISLQSITGGEAGTGVPPVSVGGTLLDGSSQAMLITVCALFVVLAIVNLLLFSRGTGATLLLVGEATPAAQVFGMHIRLAKITVWTWATVLGALAGAAYGLTVGFLNPTIFVVFLSISLLVAGLVGGARSVTGAWLGGLLVGTLPPNIQSLVPASSTGIVFGAVLLVALLAGHGGLGSVIDRCLGVLLVRVQRRRS